MNDLGLLPIATQDVLSLPSITRPVTDAGVPSIIGFFNQIKQEFVSVAARFSKSLRAEHLRASTVSTTA